MKKKVLLIVLTMVCCGFVTKAQAQDFWNALQQAASAVNSAVNATQNVSNYIDSRQQKPSTPSYSSLGTVRAKRFNGNSIATATLEIVKTSDGEYKAVKNGSLYSIYENSSYNSYCSDPSSSGYYRYYINASGVYYFNW